MKPLPFALMPALLLAACANQAPSPAAGADGNRSAVNAACRVEAERVVRYRDRGQLMRQDDYNARVGTSSHLGPQVMTDQIAQIYDRDRIAADCVRGANSGPVPAAPAAEPVAAPAEAPAPTPTRRRGSSAGR
jgi:hypothetical protein